MEDPSTPCWRIATLWIAACQCGRYCTSWLHIHWPGYEYYVYYVILYVLIRVAIILSKQGSKLWWKCAREMSYNLPLPFPFCYLRWSGCLVLWRASIGAASDGAGPCAWGHCPRKLSMFLVVMETGQPTEQHWSDWMIWIMDVHKFRLHIILYTFHNHALSVVGDSQYRSHPWFQSRSQPQLPGFGATIMGSLLVQPSAGCQMLRKKRQVWGIAGEKPQQTLRREFSGDWGLRYNLLLLCKYLKFQKLDQSPFKQMSRVHGGTIVTRGI